MQKPCQEKQNVIDSRFFDQRLRRVKRFAWPDNPRADATTNPVRSAASLCQDRPIERPPSCLTLTD